jgi:sugar phosphate isomerase/epimerase
MKNWPIGVFAQCGCRLGGPLGSDQGFASSHDPLHAPHPESRNPAKAAELRRQLEAHGRSINGVFGGFEGESYADIPTVVRTIGLVPLETRASRLAEMKQIADFAKGLDCDAVALHLGFVPEDDSDALFPGIVEVTRDCAIT